MYITDMLSRAYLPDVKSVSTYINQYQIFKLEDEDNFIKEISQIIQFE